MMVQTVHGTNGLHMIRTVHGTNSLCTKNPDIVHLHSKGHGALTVQLPLQLTNMLLNKCYVNIRQNISVKYTCMQNK